MGKILATVVVAMGIGVGIQGLAAGAQPLCRTVYARGSDTSNPPSSVAVHACDRLVVEFMIGTQGEIVPDWNISRKPATKILKFMKKTYGSSGSSGETATQDFYFKALARGKTRVSFRETTPSPGYGTLDSFTMKVTVLRRRKH